MTNLTLLFNTGIYSDYNCSINGKMYALHKEVLKRFTFFKNFESSSYELKYHDGQLLSEKIIGHIILYFYGGGTLYFYIKKYVEEEYPQLVGRKLRNYLYYEYICSYFKLNEDRIRIVDKLFYYIKYTVEYDTRVKENDSKREYINLFELNYIQNNLNGAKIYTRDVLMRYLIFSTSDFKQILLEENGRDTYRIIYYKICYALKKKCDEMSKIDFIAEQKKDKKGSLLLFERSSQFVELFGRVKKVICDDRKDVTMKSDDLLSLCQTTIDEYITILQ